ncbi:MAG: GatB/YqeY domain-containing protein [Pseudonocardiales bacterium]
MGTLKDRLRADLTASMKARNGLTTATLRMVLSAVHTEEVSGNTARELSDPEVSAVLRRERKKRAEAAQAFADGGRPESAERERAESAVLEAYLPKQLSDEELTELVSRVLAELSLSGVPSFGAGMKAVQARVAGRADGARVAPEVRRQLGTG